MKCINCGNECENGINNCPNCGAKLEFTLENKNDNFAECFVDIIKYVGKVLVKPIDAVRNNDSMSNPVFAFILSILVSLVMVISNLIVQIISVSKVQKYTFGKGYENLWQFSNIKNLNFLELIFKNFFIYVLIIIAIAGVFYLSSLVIKKEINFFKSLTISATSVIPFVLCSFVLMPILTLVWSHFVIVTLFGFVYSISLLLSLYNEELSLEGNTKIYYFSVNVGILVLVAYICVITLFKSLLLGL